MGGLSSLNRERKRAEGRVSNVGQSVVNEFKRAPSNIFEQGNAFNQNSFLNPENAYDRGEDNLKKYDAKLFSENSVFRNTSPFNPVTQFDSARTAVQNPKDAFRFLDDQRSDNTLQYLLSGGGGPAFAMAQGAANANAQDFNLLSDQDLYRKQSETSRPRDNPFEAQNFDQFTGVYGARNSPRVYATDNSFVYPDTPITRPNTALIPATAQPQVVGGTAPLAAPQFTPEVTAQTATPGYTGLTPETVAKQFQIPAQPRRRSATVVR